jgi:chromosome segregation ATPase
LTKEITEKYKEELVILKNLNATLEKLDNQINAYSEELNKINKSRMQLEETYPEDNKTMNDLYLLDMKTMSELLELEKKYRKRIQKNRKYKNEVENSIAKTIKKLQKNESIIKSTKTRKNTLRNHLKKWIHTMKVTYADIYDL